MPLMGVLGNSLCLDLLGEHAQAVRKGSFFAPASGSSSGLFLGEKEGFALRRIFGKCLGRDSQPVKEKGRLPRARSSLTRWKNPRPGCWR